MANVDKPNGFRFAYTTHGGPPTIHKYTNSAVLLYPGDLVHISSGVVESIISTETPMGVALNYASATGGETVYVMDDLTNTVFKVQADGALAVTQIGDYFDVTCTAGDTTTLQGQQELDVDATAEDQLLLIGKVDEPNNAWAANVNVYVKIRTDSQATVLTAT